MQCSDVRLTWPTSPSSAPGSKAHFEEKFNPALINAKHCDGFQITGEGTLDGAGMPIWEAVLEVAQRGARSTQLPQHRHSPRPARSSSKARATSPIDGITFKDSQYWNLHLYNCDGVTVRQARFHVPDDYRQAPSTDGIDIDSSPNVTVDGCFFSVTDDCIACKGSKGPNADKDTDSPSVEHIRVATAITSAAAVS